MRAEGLAIDGLERVAHDAVSRQGWRDVEGNRPTPDEVRWDVIDVVSRGEGYGLMRWERGLSAHSTVSVTAVGRRAIARAWEHPAE